MDGQTRVTRRDALRVGGTLLGTSALASGTGRAQQSTETSSSQRTHDNPSGSLTHEWVSGGRYESGPIAAANGRIFLIPAGGRAIDVLSLETGQGQQLITTEASNLSGLTVADDILYASHEGGVTAFDTTRGEVWWQRQSGLGEPRYHPLVLDNWILVPNEQLGVYNAETSEELFVYAGQGSGPLAATTDQFFWLDRRSIRAFSVADGSPMWTREIQAEEYYPRPKNIATANGAVIGGIGHTVAAFEAATGTQRWVHDLGDEPRSQFVATPEALYVAHGYDNPVLKKLNTSSGEVMWRSRLPSDDGAGRPTVIGTTVLLMNGNTLIAIDSLSGDVRWERAFGNRLRIGSSPNDSPITVVGDRLLVQSDDGHVYSFRTEFDPWPQTSEGMGLGALAGLAAVAGAGLLSRWRGGA
ncbi:PQQ repeat protein [Haloferax gibbonsii]|uniref:PQQ repeat protein n=1 Tax=Haloferax gibbonsii TaxID=35746 RepID=A0A871BIZ6_HALGI|nr:PQQ-binding-like beta-propeller repeat protein [Haloferax gibbonsii]QOS12750.1 PQQ repeat protein [Haloferax gibbonsii]